MGVLKQAGLQSRWKGKPSRKGSGFESPLQPLQHWHVDVSYINLSGTFYYLCSVLDGCSRFLVHWDLRESMKEADIEMILERAKKRCPDAKPRIISDNGHAVHRTGLQRVHSHLGDDTRAHLAVLSAVEREDRTLA
jgi:transposase InsO family protein